MDAHVSHLFSEVIAEDRIPVPQQVARELVKRKGFPQLLSGPLGGRVGSHIEMKNAATVMGQHQKHVKDVKTDCGDSEEIRRRRAARRGFPRTYAKSERVASGIEPCIC